MTALLLALTLVPQHPHDGLRPRAPLIPSYTEQVEPQVDPEEGQAVLIRQVIVRLDTMHTRLGVMMTALCVIAGAIIGCLVGMVLEPFVRRR